MFSNCADGQCSTWVILLPLETTSSAKHIVSCISVKSAWISLISHGIVFCSRSKISKVRFLLAIWRGSHTLFKIFNLPGKASTSLSKFKPTLNLYWRAEQCSAPPGGRAELRSDAWPRPPSLGLRPIHLVPLRKARSADRR